MPQSQQAAHYFQPGWITPSDEVLKVDLCVYGGNAGGVSAAVSAARRGKRVVLLHPGLFLGGMSSGGLSYTDVGNRDAIGGQAARFYDDTGRHYGVEREFHFEPHVAEAIFERWVRDHDIPVYRAQFLHGVALRRQKLTHVRMLGGLTVEASAFIDATYEGDLMAMAGVPYVVGREGNLRYGETLNGVQIPDKHQFDCQVSPYIEPGNPASGLLPWVSPVEPGPLGRGDFHVQAYNFRVCLSNRPDNRVPFEKPAGYDPLEYVLAARWLAGTPDENIFRKFDPIQGKGKVDTNNYGAVSTDYIGASNGWPEGDYATRERIFQDHVRYQRGLHWFMANDSSVRPDIREQYAQWGLAADEFVQTGNWPHQIYVREARRMLGDAVITEHHCLGGQGCDDPIGLGAYQMDSHNCRRLVRDGCVINEGDVQTPLPRPYGIPYKAVVPPSGSVRNLAVPVCLSASHIAFGSVRMEPVFMILGESAATAACMAMEEGCDMQDVQYPALRDELLEAGQILKPVRDNAGVAGNLRDGVGV